MELKISDFVASIKKEGIDAAKSEAEKIISDARIKAEKIIKDAKIQSENILNSAAEQTELLKKSALTAAQQAKRDAALSFRVSIQNEYEKILKSEVKKVIESSELAQIIKAVINGEDASEYVLQLKKLDETVKSALADEIRNGLEIKISDSVDSGFRLSMKDGSGFFDCSEEAICEMLTPFIGMNIPEVEK